MRREQDAQPEEETVFDTEALMSAAPAGDDDFGDFDLTSFPELDDLDLSGDDDDVSAGDLDDLDIDI